MRHYLVQRTAKGWDVINTPELNSEDEAATYLQTKYTEKERTKIAIVTSLPRSLGDGVSEMDATAFCNPTDASIKV